MEQQSKLITFFDSPERISNEEILKEILRFKQNSVINQLLEGFPELAVLVNQHRQIVAFNSKALEAFRVNDYFEIIGKRVGEAINCIHSKETDSGCGTSYFCRECGAARALIRTHEKEETADEECRISVDINGNIVAMDFSVHTRPIYFDGNVYTMFTVRDISSNKRREALERIFFHDVLNTVQAVKGLTEILPDLNDGESKTEITNAIISSTRQLMHEIKAQSSLRSAEDGHLEPDIVLTTTGRIVDGVAELYTNNPQFIDKVLKFDFTNYDLQLSTDISLAVRSLGNLVKNALEASSPSQEVNVSIKENNNEILFQVHNQTSIPENVQLRLFQRSFSTKTNKGHGIGLYSVRLIVNQYLKGHVEYISNQTEGTTFTIHLPK